MRALRLTCLFAAATCLWAAPALAQCMNPDPNGENDCDMDGCRARIGATVLDCNDNDPTIRGPGCPGRGGGNPIPPGAAPELCDNKDNNCNGSTDEAPVADAGVACPNSGLPGLCQAGTTVCTAGALVCRANTMPMTVMEACNNVDDDCDSQTDEGVTQSCYSGPNGTVNVGRCRAGTQACMAGTFGGACMNEILPANPPAQPETTCNNIDDDCDGTRDDGVTQACYSGPGGTQNVGICRGGTQTCMNGTFGASCAGEVTPANPPAQAETSCNNQDDDCDGTIDDGATVRCYTGPAATFTGSCPGPSCTPRGACRVGAQVCMAGMGTGACTGQVLPVGNPADPETTCNNVDEDCDGTVDDGVAAQACYTGPGGTQNVGICRGGTQACMNGSFSGACSGQVLPANPPAQAETSCNNQDDDCDGTVDDGATVRCYTGPAGTFTGTCPGPSCTPRGTCAVGTQACVAGMGSGVCTGQVLPTGTPTDPETTCNNLDDDCDGTVDDGVTPQACYTGPAGTLNVGRCRGGTRACVNGSFSGACSGQVTPANTPANPEANTSCNGIDDDCDGTVDDGVTPSCYTGPSGTVNRGICRAGTQMCVGGMPSGACVGQVVPESPSGMPEMLCDGRDEDCDGTVDDGLGGGACTTGLPGVCSAGTERCRMTSPGVFQLVCEPTVAVGSRAETCNNVDDDCDGMIDDNVPARPCYDGPSNSFQGTCGLSDGGTQMSGAGSMCLVRAPCIGATQQCNGAGGWLACGASQRLPQAEVCNNADDNCNGTIDDGLIVDADNDTVRACNTCGADAGACDCNDNNNMIRPGRIEVCNGLDDNCDGRLDEASTGTGKIAQSCYSGPAGTAGRGVCVQGTQECNAAPGSNMASFGACMGERVPSMEACNNQDDDCDGTIDDGFDVDNDGFRACMACGLTMNCDCDDTNAQIRPGATELCDTIDQNCNGRLDDVMPRPCFSDPMGMNPPPTTYTGTCPGPTCQPRGVCRAGTQSCTMAGDWGVCAGPTLPRAEQCDGTDDDCDGTVDNGMFDRDMDTFVSCALCMNRPADAGACDCNDMDPAIKPGAPEICDNVDNDCNGLTDGNNTACYSGPALTRGRGICRDGAQMCVMGMGQGTCAGEVLPTLLPDGGVPRFVPDAGVDGGINDPEFLCDGRDEDCDGIIDDGFDQDGDGVTTCQNDCDDTDAFNKPGGAEICDCRDNNCNSVIDDSNVCRGAPCFDFDRDGFTNCQGDCNDDPLRGGFTVGPTKSELVGDNLDNDCDGQVDENTDEDGDGFTTGGPMAMRDCNDKIADVNPGAVERCDGFDNNCDGRVDEGFDQDNDFVAVCAGDCDDMDPTRNPTRVEVCGNMKDDNCDGRIDEDTDADSDGVSTCAGDCNDFNATVHGAAGAVMAAAEVCDGQDNDCDGAFDEGFDQDNDRTAVCFGDCDDTNPNIGPFTFEVPNNMIDDDCDGQVDEGQMDRDNDGFPPVCGDCNDFDPNINPRAAEVCNRVDDNCDAYVDSAPGRFNLCSVCFDADGDGQTNCDGDCNDTDRNVFRGAPELCDLKDNDCDLQVDLDPVTGRRVCMTDDGGMPGDDGGIDGGADAGQGDVDAGGTLEPTDAGDGQSGPPGVVATGCGCNATDPASALLAGLALLVARRRRRSRGATTRERATVAPMLLVAVLGLTTGCPSQLTTPMVGTGGGAGGGNTGGGDGDAGLDDAGVDAGFVEPENWPCPGLAPVEQTVRSVPGTQNPFAISKRYSVVENTPAQALVFADDPVDLAGFVLQKPIPTAIDPTMPGAIERLAATEVDALVQLSGSPLVRDRLERSSRVFVNDERPVRVLRTASTSQLLSFGTPTTAFSLRNRLLSALSGRDPGMLGTLPQGPAGATEDDEQVVSLFFRFGLSPEGQADRLFVGVVVSPASRLRDNLSALNDYSNGSHLADLRGQLANVCEKRMTPALKTDFLFVIDNTVSMVEEQAALQQAAQGLFDAFQRSGLDFRVGVVTTDSDILRGKGFVTDIADFRAAAQVGLDGNTTELGIEFGLRGIRRARAATTPALQLRDPMSTGLVVIFMSDEDNKSLRPGMFGSYISDYRMEGAVAFAIVGPKPTGCIRVGRGEASPGDQYIDLANATGGSSGSICNPNLTEVIEEVVIGALGASSRSSLVRRPISGALSVRTTMEIARNRTSGFDYEAAGNSILFFGMAAPAVGAPYDAAYQFFNYID